MTHGEIWWIDFGIPAGSLPGYRRPAIIVQNDEICSRDLNTVVVIPITSDVSKAEYKPNLFLKKEETQLPKDSVALIHLIGAANKYAFVEKIGSLPEDSYNSLAKAVDTFIRN